MTNIFLKRTIKVSFILVQAKLHYASTLFGHLCIRVNDVYGSRLYNKQSYIH